MRKVIILCILFNIVAMSQEIFKTFALCTIVEGSEYCIVSNSVANIDTRYMPYSLKIVSSNKDIYMYNIDSVISVPDNTYFKTVEVTEYINDTVGKKYVTLYNEDNIVMVDKLSGCYIKRYFTGTIDVFIGKYEIKTIKMDDYFGYYEKCVKTNIEVN